MRLVINNHEIEIKENISNIDGLSFIPQIEGLSNDEDWSFFTKPCSKEVSDNDFNLVKSVTKKYMTHGVMEIGISRNGYGSFTQAILHNKPDNIKYVGVDVDDKSYLNNTNKNIFTIRESSFNQKKVREYLNNLGLEKISILFIDGWHSVNACINDWMYTDLISDDGIIIFHDTNYHPGPRVIIETIDKSKYRLERHFIDEDDYGVTIAYKI
jgi:predicted O-methyltransferase YrrM